MSTCSVSSGIASSEFWIELCTMDMDMDFIRYTCKGAVVHLGGWRTLLDYMYGGGASVVSVFIVLIAQGECKVL